MLSAAALGGASVDRSGLAQWYLLPALFAGGVVLGGLEEVGWRGYLLPGLQDRWSALTASLAVGVVWAVWHAPLFLMSGTTQASTAFGWFMLQALGLSVVFTWLFNATGGSMLLAVLVHGALNAWYSAAVQWLAPDTVGTFMPYAALLTAIVAGLLVWRYGPAQLARQGRHAWRGSPAGGLL